MLVWLTFRYLGSVYHQFMKMNGCLCNVDKHIEKIVYQQCTLVSYDLLLPGTREGHGTREK